MNLDGYMSTDVEYNWLEGPDSFKISNGIFLPTFQIEGYRKSKKNAVLSIGK